MKNEGEIERIQRDEKQRAANAGDLAVVSCGACGGLFVRARVAHLEACPVCGADRADRADGPEQGGDRAA